MRPRPPASLLLPLLLLASMACTSTAGPLPTTAPNPAPTVATTQPAPPTAAPAGPATTAAAQPVEDDLAPDRPDVDADLVAPGVVQVQPDTDRPPSATPTPATAADRINLGPATVEVHLEDGRATIRVRPVDGPAEVHVRTDVRSASHDPLHVTDRTTGTAHQVLLVLLDLEGIGAATEAVIVAPAAQDALLVPSGPQAGLAVHANDDELALTWQADDPAAPACCPSSRQQTLTVSYDNDVPTVTGR